MSSAAGAGAPFDPAADGWKLLPERGFPVIVGTFWSKKFEEGYRFGFVAEPRHANVGGVVHGGMLMTFMDDLLGASVWFAVKQRPVSTIQLNNRFISPARPGDFVTMTPQVERVTKSVVFVSGALHVGERLVMASDGVWKILGEK
jgi:acyl-coenzyme A thioesterase PaaI-like protein